MSERMTSELLDRIDAWKAYVDAPERIHTTLWLSEQLTTAKQYIEHLRSQTPPQAVTVTQDEMFVRCYLYDSVATFNTYADMHRAKGTPEGDEKAKHNQDMAKRGYEAFRKYMALTEKPAPTVTPLTEEERRLLDDVAGFLASENSLVNSHEHAKKIRALRDRLSAFPTAQENERG